AERELGPVRTFRHLGKWASTHEVLVDQTRAIEASDPQPAFFSGHAPIPGSPWNPANPKVKVLPAGSGVAYAKAFRAAGRVWLLTPDLLLVPADRVFAYHRSSFRGVELGGDRKLPMAWVRAAQGAARYRLVGRTWSATAERWPNKTPVWLTGK